MIFALGVLSGAVLQKYSAFGYRLRAVGVKSIFSLMSARVISQPPISAEPGIPGKFSGKLSLVILTGQSNMSGRGDLPPEQSIHPRIFMFRVPTAGPREGRKWWAEGRPPESFSSFIPRPSTLFASLVNCWKTIKLTLAASAC